MKRLTVPERMPDAGHSAWRVALRRAAHQLFDEPVVFRDEFAVRLLGDAGAEALRRTPAAQKRVWSKSLRAFVVARSAYAEQCLAAAYGEGTRQYCLLGAGLDTFALRNPWMDLRVFELDQPVVQAWKRELAGRAGLSFAGRCEWVAGDLAALVDGSDGCGAAERIVEVEGGKLGRERRLDGVNAGGAGRAMARRDQELARVLDRVLDRKLDEGLDRELARAPIGSGGGVAWPPGGMDPGRRAVFAMLGVAPFLGPEALRAVLGRVRGFPPGSAIVFDYRLPREALGEEERRQHDSLQKRATAKGEPFAEGWTPEEMAGALRGFARVEDLGGAELNARYFGGIGAGRQDGLAVRGAAARVMLAVV